MKSRGKKMIAPIVVSVVMVLYYVVYFGFLISVLDGIWKYALGIIPFILSALTVKVCIDRIKEITEAIKAYDKIINGGEEDDISKY